MSEDDRIGRLEERLAALEAVVAGLPGRVPSGRMGSGEAGTQAGRRGSGEAGKEPTKPVTSAGLHSPGAGASPPPRVPAVALPRFPASPLNPEQWIGQRVLLAIGVVALILAAGYLLRLSFDRGWISPIMRCIGGACAGVIVGAVGWRLQPRYRTYGAALIGCGAAIIFLSVWAAAQLYEVLPPTTGILGLAMV
jgi:uncharacterized membrane protein